MLEARVGRLEDGMKDVKSALVAIQAELRHMPRASDLTSLRGELSALAAEVAEVKGRVSQMPTLLQVMIVVLTTWSVGTAMVFTLLRYARP